MILRQLVAFQCVAKHLNETKAARELRTSQPSVSRDIKSLEAEYGINLFSNTPKGFVLTQDGENFQTYVERILGAVRELDEHWHQQSRKAELQQLKIGICNSRTGSFSASILARFTKSHPNVKVELIVNSMRAIETAILKGSVELAICKRSPLSPQLVYEPYISFPIVFFVAKNHPLAKTSPTFSTLAKYPFIIYERVENGATTRTLMSVLGKTGYVPNVSMRCESPRIVRHAVKEQLGIGLMYYDLIESEAQNGIFKILEVPALSIERGSFVVYQKAKPLSDCGQNFLQLLREDRDRFRLN